MRTAIAALFAAGLAAFPISAAKAQYCSSPLSLPFCIAGAAVNTAAAIATAPLYGLSGRPYYYDSGGPYYYYNGGPHYYHGTRVSYRRPQTASHDNLKAARLACDGTHPARIGDYLPHADRVNAAVERYALEASRYPDLVRLQEQVRNDISERIDQRAIGPRDGEDQMAAADKAIGAAEHERDAAHTEAADQHIAQVQAMLKHPVPSDAPATAPSNAPAPTPSNAPAAAPSNAPN